MKFIPSRELRVHPGKVWQVLKKERELIVTSNGQPVAMMLPVTGDDFEQTLLSVRRARAAEAVKRIQQRSIEKGLDKMSMAEIDEEIRKSRRTRSR